MHPFEKYNVTIGDDVVVAYYAGDGSVNSFAGEIGSSPKDGDLLLFLDDNAGVLIAHSAIVSIQTTENLTTRYAEELTQDAINRSGPYRNPID
jgi:hypothetical protein